jgi:hypothetical protein
MRPQGDRFQVTLKTIYLLDRIVEVLKKSSDRFYEPEISRQRSIMKEAIPNYLLRLTWMPKLLTLHLRI